MNTKVVVTGSRGFIAHHTIPLLIAAGYEVVTFDLLDGQDVCRRDDIRFALAKGCKVLHLAAVARFAHAEQDPAEAYRTNVGGVATLFRAAQEVGVERVVHVSTGSVYMPVWNVPITEDHPISGSNSHYGRSKALGEEMIGLSRVPYIVLRYAHVYGTHKWHGGLIDEFISRIVRGVAPVIFGGQQSNDFIHVADVARANLLALETDNLNQRFNIGTGEATTTAAAVALLRELTGYCGPLEELPMRAFDTTRFVFDITKARRLLGYEPRWRFREGLIDVLRSGVCDTDT